MASIEIRDAGDGPIPPFIRLGGLNTESATPSAVSLDHVRSSMTRNLPSIEGMPGFKVVKPTDQRVALVGGGPSVKQTVEELRGFETIVACGSVHDWLIENGITPTFCVLADPDPAITVEYIRRANPATTYLVATQCAPSVFEALMGCSVVLWHCMNDSYNVFCMENGDGGGYPGIGGGCTVGLRALSIFMLFGYRNIHFFGFDSCLGASDDDHHAYAFRDAAEEVGEVYQIKIGADGPGDRTYRVVGYHLAQAAHFKDFWATYSNFFVPTFHGDGLLTDLWIDVTARAAEQAKQLETES